MSNFSPDQERQIREFVKANQLINAIKLYREITGVGLAEAKSAVEAMARGESVNITPLTPQTPLDDSIVESKIRELLAKNKKIDAVKLYREMYRVGLKEAKDAVERMEGQGIGVDFPVPQAQFNDPFLETRIMELLARRKKIDAIKLYREVHPVGLKEAKDVIDGMEASMRSEGASTNMPSVQMSSPPAISNDPFDDDSASTQLRLVLMIALVLLILGGAVAYFLIRGF